MQSRLTEKDKLKINEFLDYGGDIPNHVAMIMDGNGRWAKKRGLPRVEGHRRGVETVREIVETCALLGVKYLTIYTFSTENWKRPKDEVSTLMRLIVRSLQSETNELHSNNVRLTTIGDTSMLPDIVRKELCTAMEKTANNTKLTLNLALSYSGRWEILEAVKGISEKVKNGELDIEQIDEKLFSGYLSTSEIPDPDLLIRSGGEYRISNFLLWQIAYSELYVTNVLWPEFRYKDMLLAIEDFQGRERRFGLVSEQLQNKRKKIQNVKKLSNQIA
ncbi:MAG: isoprenyl transferase [Melioribacteraceae bacterium]|nr:MAG: isoprenyl transferase [Melioribacteraceae bacterium]